MADNLSNEKSDWERGKDCLEIVLKHFTIEQLEALANNLNDKQFQSSLKYKLLKKTIISIF